MRLVFFVVLSSILWGAWIHHVHAIGIKEKEMDRIEEFITQKHTRAKRGGRDKEMDRIAKELFPLQDDNDNEFAPLDQLEPLVIPIPVKICVDQEDEGPIDSSLLASTLQTMLPVHAPKYVHENVLLQGIQYGFLFSVVEKRKDQQNCAQSDIRVDVTQKNDRMAEGSSQNDAFTKLVDTVTIQFSSITASSNDPAAKERNRIEASGRVAGQVLSLLEAYHAPDLSRKLFFSLLEDDGVEISVAGFRRQGQEDPLENLDLTTISTTVSTWLGIEDAHKSLVKAATRDLVDHPGVLAALIHAQDTYQRGERYDPQIGRYIAHIPEQEEQEEEDAGTKLVDAPEFVQGISKSADSLFRLASAAKLMRMRKREIHVYVLQGLTDSEMFVGKRRLYSRGTDVAIMVPADSGNFNLTSCILLGLANSLSGLPSQHYEYFEKSLGSSSSSTVHIPSYMNSINAEREEEEEEVRSDVEKKRKKKKKKNKSKPQTFFPSWLNQRAESNIVLHEYVQYMNASREAHAVLVRRSLSEEDMDSLEIRSLAADFHEVRKYIVQLEWSKARKLLRGPIHARVRALKKREKVEQNRPCCETVTVSSSSSSTFSSSASAFEPKLNKKTIFAVVYFAVFLVFLSGLSLAIFLSSRPSSIKSVRYVFSREHLD